MRLLLVEDDEMIAAAMQDGLRQSGYTVDWARDGREAELAHQPVRARGVDARHPPRERRKRRDRQHARCEEQPHRVGHAFPTILGRASDT